MFDQELIKENEKNLISVCYLGTFSSNTAPPVKDQNINYSLQNLRDKIYWTIIITTNKQFTFHFILWYLPILQ